MGSSTAGPELQPGKQQNNGGSMLRDQHKSSLAKFLTAVQDRLGPAAGVTVGFILLVIVSFALSPHVFLSARNIINILVQASKLGVVAVGMTLVIISAGIDLSVGSAVSLLSVLGALMFASGTGLPWFVIFPLLLVIAFVLGAGEAGLMISRNVPAFIVTLATLSIFQGLASTFAGGRSVGGIAGTWAEMGLMRLGWHPVWIILLLLMCGGLLYVNLRYSPYERLGGVPVPVIETGLLFVGGMIALRYLPLPAILMFVTFILGDFVLKHVRFGRNTYLLGTDEESARLSGVPLNWTKILIYGGIMMCCALGAIIFSSRIHTGDPWAGRGGQLIQSGMELDAIAAVIVGGTPFCGGRGSVWGTFLGVLIMTIIINLMNILNVPPAYQGTAKGVIILLAITLYRVKEE